ncbi:hypothetical protein OIU76_011928 [Salix suchowensis]|nr:hypothetical protein OIU76_011928 [Salix suchowensis]
MWVPCTVVLVTSLVSFSADVRCEVVHPGQGLCTVVPLFLLLKVTSRPRWLLASQCWKDLKRMRRQNLRSGVCFLNKATLFCDSAWACFGCCLAWFLEGGWIGGGLSLLPCLGGLMSGIRFSVRVQTDRAAEGSQPQPCIAIAITDCCLLAAAASVWVGFWALVAFKPRWRLRVAVLL